ncbi:MAG: glycosyltransferase family 92 protein [Chloroflexi bacterium]|jgi:tetratricopeptide (TPR) repeat protein|nr:glycosyltransferase family 92 protein [Chloroflexota bacterium]
MDYLSLCLICKDENAYLSEWLNYHILMGVDRFYIYDNESKVSLRESLKEYIERGWVVVVDISGKAMQLYAYDHCLQTFGVNTFWLGFIDTDEFLVPKTTQDLKKLLKEYEAYGGLAVSSLFFGSSGHKTRPAAGQIAAYTRRTHTTFKENEMIKSIIQPSLVMMPNSPHNFTFKENAWCVNEGFLRVEGQRFPNYTEKIQLNHYYCRSEQEIGLKLRRGRGDADSSYARMRFDVINSIANYEDVSILQNLKTLFLDIGLVVAPGSQMINLLEKMATLASAGRPAPPVDGEVPPPSEANNFRSEFSSMEILKAQTQAAISRREFDEARRITLLLLQRVPHNINLYVDLALVYLNLDDPQAAWQSLTRAWQLSPNNYAVLSGMVFYFLRIDNFSMAENACRLLLELAPHELVALGMMTHSLIGQERYEEAIKVGLPVVELAGQFGEMPDQMGVFLVKKMADYLLEKKDYAGAAHLWEAGVKCQPGEVNVLLELSKSLFLAGDTAGARQRLSQAQSLAPQNGAVLDLIRQVDALRPAHHVHKRKH